MEDHETALNISYLVKRCKTIASINYEFRWLSYRTESSKDVLSSFTSHAHRGKPVFSVAFKQTLNYNVIYLQIKSSFKMYILIGKSNR